MRQGPRATVPSAYCATRVHADGLQGGGAGVSVQRRDGSRLPFFISLDDSIARIESICLNNAPVDFGKARFGPFGARVRLDA